MNEARCPDPGELSALALGQLNLARIETVIDHLDQCPECQAHLDSLEAVSDGFLNDMRHAAGAGLIETDPDFVRALSAVDELVMSVDELVMSSDECAEIGSYVLIRELGAGGFGKVFLAQDRFMLRQVAVKVLHPHRQADSRIRSRFLREMSAIGQLAAHPNVVLAYHAGEESGRLFLVMEFVEGEALNRLVQQRGPLPVDSACGIIRQAAIGLQYIHSQGLIHRDVKPHNLLLSTGGLVKVLDLGIARVVGSPLADGGMTSSGQLLGTLDFVAPEQTYDARTVDIRADIYSLGCTLYFLLTGQVPFPGRDPIAKIASHREKPLPSIRDLRGDLPAALDSVIGKMTAKIPDDRYDSPSCVMEALETYSAQVDLKNLLVSDVGSAESSPLSGSTEPLTADTPSRPGRFSRRRWFGWVAASAAPIGLGALIGASYARRNQQMAGREGVPYGPISDSLMRLGVRAAMAISTDGRRAAVYDGEALRLFDTHPGRESATQSLASERGLQQGGVVFTSDDRLIVVATNDGPRSSRLTWLSALDLTRVGGKRIFDAAMTGLAVGDRGEVITADNRGRVHVWPTAGADPSEEFRHAQSVRSIAVSTGGKRLVTGCDDGRVRVWSPGVSSEPMAVLDGPNTPRAGNWIAVGVSDDLGRVAAVSQIDGALWVWPLAPGVEGREPTPLSLMSELTAATIAIDVTVAWVGNSEGASVLWDIGRGCEVARYRRHTGPVSALAITADGAWAVSASAEDHTAWAYHLPSGTG